MSLITCWVPLIMSPDPLARKETSPNLTLADPVVWAQESRQTVAGTTLLNLQYIG